MDPILESIDDSDIFPPYWRVYDPKNPPVQEEHNPPLAVHCANSACGKELAIRLSEPGKRTFYCLDCWEKYHGV